MREPDLGSGSPPGAHPDCRCSVLPKSSTFSTKLFGYSSMVRAAVVMRSCLDAGCITSSSGLGAGVNSFFGISTILVISVQQARRSSLLIPGLNGAASASNCRWWTVALAGVDRRDERCSQYWRLRLRLVGYSRALPQRDHRRAVRAYSRRSASPPVPQASAWLDPIQGKVSFWFWVVGFAIRIHRSPRARPSHAGADSPPAALTDVRRC